MDTIAPPVPAVPAELRHRRVRLGLGTAAAAVACGYVRAAIAAWSVPVNPAVATMLTSDLVINAVTNGARETVMLGISWVPARFRVEVHDAAVPGESWERAGSGADADRGLLLAAALAADSGHYCTPAGRAVYYVLAPEPARPVLGGPPAITREARVPRFPGTDRGLPPREPASGGGEP